ncbi:hypothetical protein [Microbulbifer pacificus]|uniref:hypothetical protein n=1 Tax=Microbulbifer pacificus TaxID=407164 RepID=UPI000CF5397C|nr:hypothetical protein [Microbulbifer pacificus]
MSFCTLTDNLGNTYQLTSGDQIASLATADYFTAIVALGRIDYLQLSAAEDQLFHFCGGDIERSLFGHPGPGWQDVDSVGIFSSQAHHPHIGIGFLPGRWPRILDAIYRGNLRFIQTDSAQKTGKEQPQDARNLLRVKIRQALLAIVAAERAEAAQHTRQLRQETSINRGLIYTGAFLTGLWQAGEGFAQWLKDVNDVMSPLQRSLRGVQAAYRASQRSDNGENLLEAYRDEILTAEKREIVQVLGFDPTAITREQFQHATELADLIWGDPALQADLRHFVKDYVKAQHAIEITEFSGAAAFEVLFTILLAAVTAGAGLAASAASLTRYFARFRKVGQLLLEFGEQTKKARMLRDRHAAAKQAPGFEDFERLGEVEIPIIKPPASRVPKRPPGLHNRAWDDIEVQKFKTRREVDMDNLSAEEKAAKDALAKQDRTDEDFEQLLSSGDSFKTRQLQPGDKLYGFDSQSNPYGTKNQKSMYWTDEAGYQDVKSKFYKDGVWDREGVKNYLALPCYNRADVIDTATVTQPHTAVESTIGIATEQIGYTEGSYSTGMLGKIMSGGGSQITPDSKAISTVTRLTGTP